MCVIYRVICFHWYPPKKLKYGKPRLGESTLTYIGLDTPNRNTLYVVYENIHVEKVKSVLLPKCHDLNHDKNPHHTVDQDSTLSSHDSSEPQHLQMPDHTGYN